jgi:L-lactate utilization protein LutB
MSEIVKTRNRLLGEQVVEALKSRFFDAYYCEDAKSAIEKALSLMPKKSSVTFGGSMTIRDMGLIKAIKADDYTVYDRDEAKAAERATFVREHFFSDCYLMSANALTEDGILFNIDGMGNRVASLIYGPKNVIVIVGINKIVKDLDAAVSRARSTAAPTNAQRFDIDTPCKKTGKCADCKSKDCICSYFVTTRICKPQGRIKVIIVGESFGY